MSVNLALENPGSRRKRLGSFYTDRKVACFLVEWAIRSPHDKVMDPSFGGGVFLEAAAQRIAAMGGHPAKHIFGVEIDEDAYRTVANPLSEKYDIPFGQLLRSDLFGIYPAFVPKMSAIVGNPPFVRFHRFAGTARERAKKRALERGVALSELASSWAAFIVHSTAFLRPNGRLAMVVPYEICHAAYAQPVLRHLAACFEEVTILTFREKLFPELNENTSLILADGYGAGKEARFYWNDLENADVLGEILAAAGKTLARTNLDRQDLITGSQRFATNLLSPGVRDLYMCLVANAVRLGTIADVGIGYVTGANDYFHLSEHDAQQRGIPEGFLKKAVRRGRSISHPTFTEADWRAGLYSGECGYLLHIPRNAKLPPSVEAYLDEGVAKRIPEAYKCRVRDPWFVVPHVHTPDALLSYMTGQRARMTANRANAVAPNSLHVVRLHITCEYSAAGIAALWQTSLTRLSCELEGHALGGGMLKLEPGEAEAVSLPRPRIACEKLDEIAEELDTASRKTRPEDVQRLADRLILQQELGLTAHECREIHDAAKMLVDRRMGNK
jgi:adenine-specific DNA-methyltransferase